MEGREKMSREYKKRRRRRRRTAACYANGPLRDLTVSSANEVEIITSASTSLGYRSGLVRRGKEGRKGGREGGRKGGTKDSLQGWVEGSRVRSGREGGKEGGKE